MTREDLEMLACLAWTVDKQKCRATNRTNHLHHCTLEQIPYWLGPSTTNLNTHAWDSLISQATFRYNFLEKQNETPNN